MVVLNLNHASLKKYLFVWLIEFIEFSKTIDPFYMPNIIYYYHFII